MCNETASQFPSAPLHVGASRLNVCFMSLKLTHSWGCSKTRVMIVSSNNAVAFRL